MARPSALCPVDFPVYFTKRGNYRQNVFLSDDNRERFLHLWQACSLSLGLRLHGWRLMTNHVHPLIEPLRAGALAA